MSTSKTSTAPPKIRPGIPEDAASLSAIIVSLARFYTVDPEHPEKATAFFEQVSAKALDDLLRDPTFRFQVAEVDGRPVGLVGVRGDSHLFHLYVAEPYHRRGIASRLWQTAKDAARAAGNPGRFTVNASLYAVPLYRRFGFTATGETVEKDGVVFLPMELVEKA
ncbi:MAG: GNAT family N-acetyltransferase [Acidobacteria bacterium]|nr:GNAT family N-acetyltransferase [Acidobacteriota bacterium]